MRIKMVHCLGKGLDIGLYVTREFPWFLLEGSFSGREKDEPSSGIGPSSCAFRGCSILAYLSVHQQWALV